MTEDGKDNIGFAERVRRAARAQGVFTARSVADAIDVKSIQEKRAVSANIRHFILRGEAARTDDGRYRYKTVAKKITNRQRMWNVIRRMGSPFFALDDLDQITGIRRKAIVRFCSWLVKAGHAERVGVGRYRRIGSYKVPVPVDELECERVRQAKRRKGKKGTRIDTD